jgi:hypothetical protein
MIASSVFPCTDRREVCDEAIPDFAYMLTKKGIASPKYGSQ